MVSPEARCPNFVSLECARRGEEGGKKRKRERERLGYKLFLLFNSLRKVMTLCAATQE